MKIGITGQSADEKAQIVTKIQFSNQFKDYNFFYSPISREVILETQIQSIAEKVIHLKHDNFISADSIIDTIAVISTAGKSITANNIMLLNDLAHQFVVKYDVIAYVEPEISKDPRLDAITKHLIERNPPKKLLILKGTIDQKTEIMVKFMDIYKYNQ